MPTKPKKPHASAQARGQVNYRLEREYRDLITTLAAEMSREYGVTVTASDVVRKAVRLLSDGRKNNSEKSEIA